RWQKLDSESAGAAAAVALAAVRLYQPDEAGPAILKTQQLGGDDALIKLIAEVSDAGGTAIALNTLRPVFDAPDISDKLLGAAVDLALESFDFATAHKLADRMLTSEPASGVARAQLALEGYSKLVEMGGGLIVRGRAARLLMKKDDRTAAFRMLDEAAQKERSEALDVEFAKAALLEDAGKSTEAIALLQLALERLPDH